MLQSNKRWFEGVDLVVISNTLWVGEKTPCLTYGMRGMLSLSVTAPPPPPPPLPPLAPPAPPTHPPTHHHTPFQAMVRWS